MTEKNDKNRHNCRCQPTERACSGEFVLDRGEPMARGLHELIGRLGDVVVTLRAQGHQEGARDVEAASEVLRRPSAPKLAMVRPRARGFYAVHRRIRP